MIFNSQELTSPSCHISNDPEGQAESENWVKWFQDFNAPYENTFEPLVDLFYPIVNDISRVDQSMVAPDLSANNTVVALIIVQIYWRDFIRDILPEGSNGIVVVVECPCNANFTYQIFGSEFKYLGVGDLHDAKYHHLEINGKPADFTTLSLHKDEYSGLPLVNDFCPYTLRLYPSDLMKSDFETSNGAIFMVSTICIFGFTSLVFFVYDWKVERRQYRVASSARQSSAIVSSLFPSTVRDQLYETQAGDDKVPKRPWGLPIDAFSTAAATANEWDVNSAIAQLYADTTVIFMDIVGFTNWSSSRQPTQVFQLLETLFAKFDALAKIHRVFKIETIGDCYVAVVGLPSKKKQHAVIMANFANDCRECIKVVLMELEAVLGEVCNLSSKFKANAPFLLNNIP
jgi:Adenylate and Guanylate cyclase catalytic domain